VCDLLLRLPMHGKATSLNLAVAAGVLLYAILEKRSSAGSR
jgi:tRNA G18 (ribose-2'-O)-methylase SpoU